MVRITEMVPLVPSPLFYNENRMTAAGYVLIGGSIPTIRETGSGYNTTVMAEFCEEKMFAL